MSVEITIEGEGLSFKGNTELSKAAAVLGFLAGDSANNVLATSIERPREWTSPRQAVVELNALTNDEKIAAFIRYHQSKTGQSSLRSRDIMQTFMRSGEQKPKNINRDIRKAVQKGYIVESDTEKKAYTLTDLGVEITKGGFRIKTKD